MGLSEEAPREPHQDSFVERSNVNATSVAIPQNQVYIHGYVMSSQPPQGPPRVYDLAELEGQRQAQHFSNAPYPVPQNYGAPQYGSASHTPAPCSQPGSGARNMVTVGYILAWFFFIPHMLSVAASLHLYKKGLLGAHKTAVLVCSYLEIAAFCLCAVASWSFVGNAPSYESWSEDDDYPYYFYSYYEQVFWFGFVYIALWGLSLLAAGIPRLVFSVQKPKVASEEVVMDEVSAARHRGYALVMYIIGIFIPPVQIVSMACSLHLLNRGQIVTYKARVMALVALELCGWLIGASMSWTVVQSCSFSSYGEGNYSYWYEQYCYYNWIGYIFLCIQFGFAIACGIPRVVFTFKGKRSSNYVQIQ